MIALFADITPSGVAISTDPTLSLPLGSGVRDVATTDSDAQIALALDELWQDGSLEAGPTGRWLLPFERLLHVDGATARILRLPEVEPNIHTELRSSGIATSTDFRIWAEFTHPTHGRIDAAPRYGPAFLITGGVCVLLTPELWRLLVTVEDAPPTDASNDTRFEYLGRCVQAAQGAEAEVDGYLREHALEVVDEIGLDVREVGDEIHLGARADGLATTELVLPNGRARPFPARPGPEGRRQRVVVSNKARGKVEQIAARSKLRGTDVPKFLQNPEAFVPEGIDLSDFSERVRGFRTKVYNSRPYLHVSKSPRGWLEFGEVQYGVNLEPTAGNEGQRDIPIDDYKKVIDEARATGERFVRYKEAWIEVDTRQAEQFISTVDRVRDLQAQNRRLNGKLLLDVIPNVDVLEFEVDIPEDVRPRRPWLSELPDVSPPSSLHAQLDAYQLLGFRWLCYLNDKGAGGLLADEMGVGKTIQVIGLVARLHEQGRLSPALIVLPKTLIANWKSELAKFAPGIDCLHVHAGPQRSRSVEFLSGMNIVLTSYDTARQDQILLGTIDWSVVVADEAQFVKNPTAARTSVVKALKGRQAIALTGTPVENGLLDFWCIIDYVQPGLLKSWSEFRSSFERPLIEATDPQEREVLVDKLLSGLDPHFLRRLKDEVLGDLPKKQEREPIMTPLGPEQRGLYQRIVAEAKSAGRGAVLGAITRLLILCSHPRAITGDWDTVEGDALAAECPKLEATMQVLDSVRVASEKALIFTSWKATQKILQRAIWARFGVVAEIVNGDITSRRQLIIDQFRSARGFDVLILAAEVAGFGLNLVEANHVIHYTRPWNPAKESQATDRVHRRGQTRPVTVYYPTVAGTVEEKLAELLASKSRLAQDVLRPTAERTVRAEEFLNSIGLPETG